jgi:predicted peptidase
MLLQGKNSPSGLEKRTVRADAETYDFQIHLPPEARDRRDLPLIVFLHGIRERGSGGFVPQDGPSGAVVNHYFRRIPAIVVLPQCRPGKYWPEPSMDAMVMAALEQTIEEFGADRARIYLIGVSMGGYGVWHFGSRHPEKFAALVPICGGSPVLSGDRFAPVARGVGQTPAWVFHGAEDKVVPVAESRQMVKAIEAAGGSVKYSEYAKVGHNVWLNVLAEKNLMPWLLANRRA